MLCCNCGRETDTFGITVMQYPSSGKYSLDLKDVNVKEFTIKLSNSISLFIQISDALIKSPRKDVTLIQKAENEEKKSYQPFTNNFPLYEEMPNFFFTKEGVAAEKG